ncbi:hypothetical protein BPUTEOSOX_577 [thiotrophic endosymbiont of Bathymodiolus puteoserpentis (Logatchev)]|nr:hypothetical protein BPUTEOSOX_577 [thiotrophic endosymbiont of Bathymodiolus puteoserpentis (Logatchev)]
MDSISCLKMIVYTFRAKAGFKIFQVGEKWVFDDYF